MVKSLKKEIFLDIKKNNQKKIIFVILQDAKQIKVFEIEADPSQEKLIRDCFDDSFEAVMRGKKVELKSKQHALPCEEITHRRGSDFLLFGIGDRAKFESYFLLDSDKHQSFNYVAVYQVGKKVKKIDKKAQRAMEVLHQLLYDKSAYVQIDYRELDVFLISTPSFRYLANTMSQKEQSVFKQTVIHGMIEKIYDNMIAKRASSNLRFALVLLKKDLSIFDKNIVSHIFYDIKNGTNVNREIIKTQPSLITDNTPLICAEEQSCMVDILIKKDDENRFILLFLNTLLSMQTNLFWDQKKVIVLVSYICYIFSTEEITVTHRAGMEKIKIDYDYMGLVQLLSQSNAPYFLLLLEKFLKGNNEISIKKFLKKDIEYHCFENKIERSITVEAFDEVVTIQSSALRQSSSRFFKNILIIGQFYRVVSQEEEMDLVIASFLKKITDRDMGMARYCQESIIPKFLSLFLTGHNRKDCEIGLRDFFDAFRRSL